SIEFWYRTPGKWPPSRAPRSSQPSRVHEGSGPTLLERKRSRARTHPLGFSGSGEQLQGQIQSRRRQGVCPFVWSRPEVQAEQILLDRPAIRVCPHAP